MKSKNLINASIVNAFVDVGYTVGVLLNKYTSYVNKRNQRVC